MAMEHPPDGEMNLLLIGMAGWGMSSTGNSILGRKVFRPKVDARRRGNSCVLGSAEVEGRRINVVDIPGYFWDTRKCCVPSIDDINETFDLCPTGFDALLLVLSCEARPTVEAMTCFRILQSLLGSDVWNKQTVCIFTGGDAFKSDFDHSIDFERWVSQSGQRGHMEIISECCYRCVLFDNVSGDEKENKIQLLRLISQVDALRRSESRYTKEHLDRAKENRAYSELVSDRVFSMDEHCRKYNDLYDEIDRLTSNPVGSTNAHVDQIEERLNELIREMNLNIDLQVTMQDKVNALEFKLRRYRTNE